LNLKNINTMKKLVFITLYLTLACAIQALGTEYYVSSLGNDNAKGTTPGESFKTLDRVNKIKLKPGDKVLLKAGDEFTGTLQLNASGSENAPITITSYGTGDKPVISGSVKISGFTKVEENVYAANCNKNIKYLYHNNEIKILARYPNDGFLEVDDATANYIIDGDLPFSENELVGANAYVYVRVWIIKNSPIKSNTNNKIEFEKPVVFHSTSGKEIISDQGFNYYLDNKKEFLDAPNEWYYAPEEEKLYVYSDNDLTKETFEGTLKKNGIILEKGVSNIVIENLSISGFTEDGIAGLGDNHDVTIRDNNIARIGKYGVYFDKYGSELSILNNNLHDITGNGIRTMNAKNSLFEGNTVKRVGTVAGYGIDGLNGSTGICVVSYEVNSTDSTKLTHNCTIRNNHVEEIGYNGIRFEGYNTLVEGNVVKNCLLTMFDGGLIYTWSNKSKYTFNCIIKDNLVINNVKEEEGEHKIRLGIYLDWAVRNMVVENNTIINTGGGIMTNGGSMNSLIKNNLLYGCESGVKIIQKNSTVDDPHSAIGNTIICLINQGTTLSLENHRGIKTSTGTVDNNTYISPNEKFHIKKIIVDNERKTEYMYTLKGWQDELGVDKNANHFVTEKDGDRYPYSDIFVNEEDEIKTFTLDPEFEYMDLEGNALHNKVKIAAKDAVVVFYKAK